ncbi:MAG TPA: hypothetical protein VM012_11900 [Flavitalea sp.]|nr:hypothetical protein [Flavitalea sp.]
MMFSKPMGRSAGLLFLSLLVFAQCKKETISKEEKVSMIINHKWMLTNVSFQVHSEKNSIDVLRAYYNDCELDDSYIFYQSGEFNRRDSTHRCIESKRFGPYGYGYGYWSVDEEVGKITINSVNKHNLEVVSLTPSSMELRESMVDRELRYVSYTYKFRAILY